MAAVVVATLAAPPDPKLADALGPDGLARLQAELAARARRWAAAVSPTHAFEATTVGAASAALHDHDGPTLLLAPDVPAVDPDVARVALEDLAAGVHAVVGVAHDARPYLLAVPRLDATLLELADEGFAGGVLRGLADRGLEVGMLRSERRLASVADARALALDPLAPAELVALVRAV